MVEPLCGLYFCPIGNLHTEALPPSSKHICWDCSEPGGDHAQAAGDLAPAAAWEDPEPPLSTWHSVLL